MISFSITFAQGYVKLYLSIISREIFLVKKGEMEILVKNGHFFVTNRVVTVLLFL